MAPSVISEVQSAADALATILPNCTIGTQQFCIGHDMPCHKLPLNVSKLIPTDVPKVLLQSILHDIQPLDDALAKVTAATIWQTLIIGVVLIFAMTALSICSTLGKFFCLTAILLRFRFLRVGILLLLGLICCSPFLVATIVLYIFRSKTEHLPSWIQVEEGEVSKLSVGGLCCAIVMWVLSIVISIIF
jgi:hypothetical protein